jgi:hypothetical protein
MFCDSYFKRPRRKELRYSAMKKEGVGISDDGSSVADKNILSEALKRRIRRTFWLSSIVKTLNPSGGL